MAQKPSSAPATQPDSPIPATIARVPDRDGVSYPALRIAGEAPRKGATIRVTLDNGVTYVGKVHGVFEDGIVETEGLTPITE